MTSLKTLLTTLATALTLAWCAGLLTPARAATAPGCDAEPSTTAWLACRARRERNPELCSAIPDGTLAHFCEEAAGAHGCVHIAEPTMRALCTSGVAIR